MALMGISKYFLQYKKNGTVQKDGINKGRAFYILQFTEGQSRTNGQEEGSYTYTCFVWVDDVKDVDLTVGDEYNAVIDSSGGKDKLVYLDYVL